MNKIRELRIEKGISLRKLAEDVHMSFSNLGSLERGEVQLHEDTAITFANYFDVSVDYLLGVSDEKKPIKSKYKKFFELHDCVDSLSDDQAKAILSLIKTYNQEEK